MYECCICQKYARRTLAEIMRHIRDVHPHFEGTVRCGIDGCPSTASSYESLRQHMYSKHKDVLTHNQPLCEPQRDLPSGLTRERDSNDGNLELDGFMIQDPIASVGPANESGPSFEAAQFILKTRDGRRLTQTATNGILQDTRIILERTVDMLQEKVMQKLKAVNTISSEDVSEIQSVFTSPSVRNPFDGLESLYLQEKFFQENFNYVPPVERVLGRSYKLAPSSGSMKEVNDCCYDVPLLSSLQALLRCDSVRDQVFNSHQLELGKLGDYCDGKQFRNHSLFKKHPCALQVTLYYDDVEVCNPLGSKAKIHKLGIFYFMLANIDPKFRSSLHTIQLVAVVRTEMIEKYPISEILEPFISDIRQLESDSGVPFMIDGEVTYLRGTLTIVSADNPAANLIGGYKSLTSAFRKCRTCMAISTNMQTEFHECQFELRTRETHAYHCSSLGGPLHAHTATTYGVTCNSILNSSRFFHVVDGIIPDIMHDILEGTLQLHIKWLLRHLIQEEKLFSLDTLNGRIQSFRYGQADSPNKPTIISHETLTSSTNSVKQSSSQAWCLGRFLPLLVGDLVSEDNEKWDNFLNLLKIMEYVFAPVTTEDKLDYLQILVEDYLTDFSELYPARPLVPKMHYLIHMPTWMKRCGPLMRNWCMRYEAKHRYFKGIAQTVGNFKNIEKTVATRHQRHMCYKMTCTTNYLGGENAYGSAHSVIVDELDYAAPILQYSTELNSSSTVHRMSYVNIYGTKYSKGSVLLCTFCDDDPLFGEVLDILATSSGDCFFILTPFIVTTFNKHFNAYEVDPLRNDFLVCRQKDFADYHVLSISKSFNRALCSKNFICLKYHVVL